jgi:hypothetical protein
MKALLKFASYGYGEISTPLMSRRSSHELVPYEYAKYQLAALPVAAKFSTVQRTHERPWNAAIGASRGYLLGTTIGTLYGMSKRKDYGWGAGLNAWRSFRTDGLAGGAAGAAAGAAIGYVLPTVDPPPKKKRGSGDDKEKRQHSSDDIWD